MELSCADVGTIQSLESRLQEAMIRSDLEALDELLAPDLVFTTHTGQVIGKQDDLSAHRSGVVKIEALCLSDQTIRLWNGIAVVSVRAEIRAVVGGMKAEDSLRFTRVWRRDDDGCWRLAAGHACAVS